jgi:Calx-beta domain
MLSVVTLLAAGALSTSPADTDHRGDEPQGSCTQRVQDGGFETGTPWTQSSTNFPPICNFSTCGNGGGTTGPVSGQGWVWFGGSPFHEQASVTQNVLLPVGTAHLGFFLRIGARSRNGADFMRILIGGNEVFAAYEYTPTSGQYELVDLDVSAYANGTTRELRFESSTFGPAVTNFSVDIVSLETCPFPSLAIANAANVTEGDAGSTNAVFNVTLSEAVSQQVTVHWTTATASSGAQATADVDYTAGSGTLTFPPGAVSVPLPIAVLGDLLDEFDERFAVSLSTPAGAVLGDASGEATIVDNDPLPSLAISDTTALEGHAGTSAAQILVTLTPASGRAVSGSYFTIDGSAVAGQDYTATSGPFNVPAGSTSAQVTVPVLGDVLDETDESFGARLLGPDFAVLADPLGLVTIDDDDGPLVRIADTAATEGNTGTTPAPFTITLSASSPQIVTVDYTTADGTAIAGADFVATSGTVTFAPGSTGAGAPVPVVGDVLDEPNEHFSVLLSNAVDARLSDVDARGAIVDDDGAVLSLSGELSHGFEQWRALAAPNARDLFVFFRPAWSSFEVLIDGASGDLSGRDGLNVVRLAPDLTTIQQGSDPAGTGPARRLSVSNEQAVPEADYIAVSSNQCTTDCGADDVYRIRVRETTLSAARFNNSGGQVTVVLLQNRTQLTVSGTLRFWSSGAVLLAEEPFSLGPLESLALNTASIAGLEGFRGSLTVTHDGPYAGLVGRALALEPSSGMSFNTVFEVRPR